MPFRMEFVRIKGGREEEEGQDGNTKKKYKEEEAQIKATGSG